PPLQLATDGEYDAVADRGAPDADGPARLLASPAVPRAARHRVRGERADRQRDQHGDEADLERPLVPEDRAAGEVHGEAADVRHPERLALRLAELRERLAQ